MRLIICSLLIFMTALCYAAELQAKPWYQVDADHQVTLNVDVFVSSTCPHCQKADQFITVLTRLNPWIKVNRYVINEDKNGLLYFHQQLNHFKSTDYSVPTFMFCDSRWLGFVSPETSGKLLLHAMEYCRQQIEQQGTLKEATRKTLKQWSATSALNLRLNINKEATSLEKIIITAWIEAFTPCSLFCVLLFLSFLYLVSTSRMSRFFTGFILIVILGVIHTWQFLFTPQYQQWLLSYMNGLAKAAGIGLLGYVFFYARAYWWRGKKIYVNACIPVVMLALIPVYAYQQSCGFNVGPIFQQWIQAQSFPAGQFIFYQLLYLLFYLLPLFLLLLIYVALKIPSKRIYFVSALIILGMIGLVLLLYPIELANFYFSVIVLLVSLFLGWHISKQS